LQNRRRGLVGGGGRGDSDGETDLYWLSAMGQSSTMLASCIVEAEAEMGDGEEEVEGTMMYAEVVVADEDGYVEDGEEGHGRVRALAFVGVT